MHVKLYCCHELPEKNDPVAQCVKISYIRSLAIVIHKSVIAEHI